MAKAFELNQLSTGDYISRSFELFSKNITRMMTWVAVSWLLPMLLLMGASYLLLDPYSWQERGLSKEPDVFSDTGYALYYWLLYIAGIVLMFGPTFGGLVYLTARLYVGDDPSLVDIARATFKRLGAVVGAGLGNVVAGVLIILLAYAIPYLLYESGSKGGGIGVGILISTPGVILLLWLFFGRYGLNMVSAVCDDGGASDAFSRSSFLTLKFRGRIFALMLLGLFVIGGPFNTGLLSLIGLLIKSMLESVGRYVLGDGLRLCWFALCIPMIVVPFVVMYFDMICRKEGYDLAVMAQNFGFTQAQMDEFRFDSSRGYLPKGYRRNSPDARKMMPPPAPTYAQQPVQQQPMQFQARMPAPRGRRMQ